MYIYTSILWYVQDCFRQNFSICDYYDYNGNYQDSYFLGDQMEVTDNMVISNTYVGGDYLALYKFTDIYAQSYWSDPVPAK